MFQVVIMATIAGSAPQRFEAPEFRYATMQQCEANLMRAVDDWTAFIRHTHPGVAVSFNAKCEQTGMPA